MNLDLFNMFARSPKNDLSFTECLAIEALKVALSKRYSAAIFFTQVKTGTEKGNNPVKFVTIAAHFASPQALPRFRKADIRGSRMPSVTARVQLCQPTASGPWEVDSVVYKVENWFECAIEQPHAECFESDEGFKTLVKLLNEMH